MRLDVRLGPEHTGRTTKVGKEFGISINTKDFKLESSMIQFVITCFSVFIIRAAKQKMNQKGAKIDLQLGHYNHGPSHRWWHI